MRSTQEIDPKPCGNCAFKHNFHNWKFGEIILFYAVKDFFHIRENKEDLLQQDTMFFKSDDGKRHMQSS